MVLAIAAVNKWNIQQLDAKTAFLNGAIDYKVIVSPPPGASIASDKVWCLKKSIYGLKQSPKIWYETLSKVLINQLSLTPSAIDPCVFFKTDLLVVVYVDDILITGASQNVIDKVTSTLSGNFTMKVMGFPQMFLGINITKIGNNIKISSQDFITKIEKEHQIVKATRLATPMVKGYNPWDDHSPLLNPNLQRTYKSIIGTLLYAANTTRIDISYATNLLSQFLVTPKVTHLNAARRVMMYLVQTKTSGIKFGHNCAAIEFKDFRLIDKSKFIDTKDYPKKTKYSLVTLSDSDYANDKSDRKSQSGHCTFLNNLLISWSSRKQTCATLSSTEAEYVSLSDAGRSSIFFCNLLNEIGMHCSYSDLVGDNISSLTLSSHKALNQKTKHIDVRYHFIRSLVQARKIKLNFISTKYNLADLLTKACDPNTFTTLTKYLLH